MAGSAVSVCYTACNVGWGTCMAASGLVAGTTGPVGWWCCWMSCCMAACVAGGLAINVVPTP